MARIQADSTYNIGNLTVNVKKIPFGTRWIKDCPSEGFKKGDLYKADRLLCGGTGKIRGVTIHNTDPSADAATYTLATFNQNMNSARVHFYVDDKEAWQNLELNEVGWHAGTGNHGKGNEDTVAIEIIMGKRVDIKKDDKTRRAFLNGALLTAYILKITGLDTDSVYTHKMWNGKNCPFYILPDMELFLKCVKYFLEKLYEAENEFNKENQAPTNSPCLNGEETSKEADKLPQNVGSSEALPEGFVENNGKHTFIKASKDGNTPDEYATDAVRKAIEKGYLLGDGNGSLRLHDGLTRQDLFVVLERMNLLN